MCAAPGCGRPTSSAFSRYCALHKANLRRHGAVDQRGLTKGELKPYEARVRARIRANPKSPVWPKMEARWEDVVRYAQVVIADWEGGQARSSYTLGAAREVVRLGALVDARDVVVTTAAVFLFDQIEPHRFRGDRAFRAQLVRRVRGLTEANATDYRDPVTGKSRRTYRELTPRSAVIMAEWLTESLGALGVHLARLERKEREAQATAERQLHEDLLDLK